MQRIVRFSLFILAVEVFVPLLAQAANPYCTPGAGSTVQLSEDPRPDRAFQTCPTDPTTDAPGSPGSSEEDLPEMPPHEDASCPPDSLTCLDPPPGTTQQDLDYLASQLASTNGMGVWGDPYTDAHLNQMGMTTHDSTGAGLSQNYAVVGDQVCSCPRSSAGGGCFAPDTKIEMGDRSFKQIDAIAVGDLVWNPELKQAVKVVRITEGPEAHSMYRLVGEHFSVAVTEFHPVLTSSGMKQARELKAGELVKVASGEFEKLNEISQIPLAPNQRVINLVLDGKEDSSHQIVGGGLVTGDNVIQSKLQKSKSK